MNRLASKTANQIRRKNRVRTVVRGSSTRPRLTVQVSSRHISVQLIDDEKHATIAQSTTVGQKNAKKTMTEQAASVGAEIAARAKAKKVKKVAFDRGSKLYHGRIKALADAARKEGLEF